MGVRSCVPAAVYTASVVATSVFSTSAVPDAPEVICGDTSLRFDTSTVTACAADRSSASPSRVTAVTTTE